MAKIDLVFLLRIEALPQNSKLQMKELANAGSAGVLARTACVAREDFRGKSGLAIVRAARSVRTGTSALPARSDFITFEAKPRIELSELAAY